MSILDDLETTGFALCKEYSEPWKNRKIRSPYTGRMVRVGSLPAKDWKKFRPGSDNAPLSAMTDFPFDVKYVMDFYVSIPKDEELATDYIEKVGGTVNAVSNSEFVRTYFPNDTFIVKLANLPVIAVDEYATWEDDEVPEDFEEMEFVKVDEDAEEEDLFNLFTETTNIAFKVTPLEYKEYIKIINDTPIEEPEEDIEESFFKPSVAEQLNSYLVKESESKVGELIVYQDKMLEIVDIIENNIAILRQTLTHNKIDDMINDGAIDVDNATEALAEYRLCYRTLVDANMNVNSTNTRILTFIGTLNKEGNE